MAKYLMDFIKTFSEFIFEARRSKHFIEQSDERVGNLLNVSFAPEVSRNIRTLGLNYEQVRENVMSAIKDIFYREADKIEKRDFSGAKGVPAGVFKIKVGNAESYIRLTMRSYKYKRDRKTGEYLLDADGNKIISTEIVHQGEKIYVCINDNSMTTVKVYNISESEEEIARDMASHFETKGRPLAVQVTPIEDWHIHKLVIEEDGSISIGGEKKPSGQSYTGIQRESQWSIRPGETIKLDIPFKGGFTDVKILEILNPEIKSYPDKNPSIIWKDDENIKVSVEVEKDGRQLKLIKTLSQDTVLYLPIGNDKSLVKCLITGKLIDKRQANPINLKFKTLE